MISTKVSLTLREVALQKLADHLRADGNEVIFTGGGEVATPVVDGEGNEGFILHTITVPKGPRDGSGYDAYAEAQAYADHLAEKAADKAAAEAKKAKKLAEKAAKVAKDITAE